jgi:Glycosyl transferases group 1
MKILHFQHNGVGVILSAAMNRLGVESIVLATDPHPFGFKEDRLLPKRTGLARPLRALDWREYFDYDIFHNHDTRIPRTAAAHWRGRIVQHYHSPKTTGPVGGASASFVSLPGIMKSVPDSVWIPLPVFSDTYTPDRRTRHDAVRVGYCAQDADPSKPQLIPAEEVRRAVERCGTKAELYPLTGLMDHADMIDYYAEIDVWVDRVGCDFYGFSTVEAASMGIPVVTQIGDFEREFVPTCPFVSVQRDEVVDAVVSLVQDDARRNELGKRSREFAVEVHDAMRVAGTCIAEYRRLLEGQ